LFWLCASRSTCRSTTCYTLPTQYINPALSRAGISRLLKREGMSRLRNLVATAEREKVTPKKTFKNYEPGFIYIDIKYLPPMPDETSRRYLFVAINHATRSVFIHIHGDMTEASSFDFLHRLKLASPIKISKILTDNGSQFTDRFTTKTRSPAASTLRRRLRSLACRTSTGAATPPSNQRHG